MPAPIPASARPILPLRAGEAPPPPEPGWFDWNTDAVMASTASAAMDVPGRAWERRTGELMTYAAEFARLTGKRASHYVLPDTSEHAGIPQIDTVSLYADLQAYRRRAGFKVLPELGEDMEDYDQRLRQRLAGEQASRERRMAAGGVVPNFIGGMAGSLTDPINIATMPLGGGAKTVLGSALKNGIINAGIEAAEQPLLALERDRQGRTLTAEEAAMNVGVAFAAGAVLDLAVKGAAKAPGAARDAFEGAVAKHWDRLPKGLQDRWLARATIDDAPLDDALLADLAEAIIGRERMSEIEAGAASTLRSEAGWQAGSPFRPDGAGQAAHAMLREEAIARIVLDNPAPARPAPGTRAFVPDTPLPGPRGSTAIASGTVPGGAIETYMARARAVESGGSDTAAAGTSSAYGRYQFTKGTWLAFYKRRFGSGGLSDAEILAKRSDGRLQDVLMRDLTETNAAVLRQGGHAVTPGNLYLAHFAGPRDARRILDADPGTPIERVMTPASIAANRFLRGKTAGQVIAWADRKMGGNGAVIRHGGASVRDDVAPDERAALQAELDAINEQVARLEQEAAGLPEGRSIDDIIDADGVPFETTADDLAAIRAEIDPAGASALPEPRAFDPDAPEAEVLALLPRLREIAGDRTRSLANLDRIADELGATAQQVRRGFTILAVREGLITMNRKRGTFMRKPKPPEGPEDVLEFIARHGGLRDDEGHNLGLVGLSKREQIELEGPNHTMTREQIKRHRRNAPKRDWQRRTRRHGSLLRHAGRSVDEMGELLWEAGYLSSPDGGRPSVKDVLAYIDERLMDGKPRYTIDDQAKYGIDNGQAYGEAEIDPHREQFEGLAIYADDPAVQAASFEILHDVREWYGIGEDTIDLYDVDAAARMIVDHARAGETLLPVEAYHRAALADEAELVDEAFAVTGDSDYDLSDDEWFALFPESRRENPADGEGIDGQPAAAGDAGPGGAQAGMAQGGASPPDLTPPDLADIPHERLTEFLDPDGPAAKAQSDSLEHDARMVAENAAVSSMHDRRIAQIETLLEQDRPPLREIQNAIEYLDEAYAQGLDVAALQDRLIAIERQRVEGRTTQNDNVPETALERAEREAIAAEDAAYQINFKDDRSFADPRTNAFKEWQAESDAATAKAAAALARYDELRAADTTNPVASAGPDGQMDFAAPTPEQARIALERQGEGRLKGSAAQKPPGSDGGLFDLGDGGKPKTTRDMLDDFDAEAAEIRSARDCLDPGGAGGKGETE